MKEDLSQMFIKYNVVVYLCLEHVKNISFLRIQIFFSSEFPQISSLFS